MSEKIAAEQGKNAVGKDNILQNKVTEILLWDEENMFQDMVMEKIVQDKEKGRGENDATGQGQGKDAV